MKNFCRILFVYTIGIQKSFVNLGRGGVCFFHRIFYRTGRGCRLTQHNHNNTTTLTKTVFSQKQKQSHNISSISTSLLLEPDTTSSVVLSVSLKTVGCLCKDSTTMLIITITTQQQRNNNNATTRTIS